MRIHPGFLSAALLLLRPAGLPAQWDYSLAIRQPTAESDALGLSFDVSYTRSRGGLEAGQFGGWRYDLTLRAAGHQDFTARADQLDFMTAGATLGAQYLASGLSEAELRRRAVLLVQDSLSDAEEAELARLSARQRETRRFLVVDGLYRMETDQQLESRQHVLGLGAAAELPFLHQLLAVVTETLGGTSPPQPVRAYLGADWVDPVDSLAFESSTLGKGTPRIRGEVAWGARILDGLGVSRPGLSEIRLRVLWQAHWLPDLPRDVEDDISSLNQFLEIWTVLPVTDQAGLLVMYAAGDLPPLYRTTSVARLGFSVSVR